MRLFASDRIARIMDRLGFEDGEMIEHPMINKSIERAQKKVEENNFGIRKRLLEYDDVMNKQRKVIYERRRHALMGQRIGMDIANMIWDRCVNIIETTDYQGAKEAFIKIFAMETPFTEEDFTRKGQEELEEIAYDAALKHFKNKTERMAQVAYPVIKDVYENKGEMYENIIVPISDGRRVYQISVPLKEAYETEGKSILIAFEKAILLHTIDNSWKENLRALDELKHSVQNASYEQKDPLLIFKFESVKLFDGMIGDINDGTISVLMRCQIPVADPNEVKEAPAEMPKRNEQRLVESKQNLDSNGDRQTQHAPSQMDTRPQAPVQTIKNEGPKIGRNDPCPCGSGKKFKNCHGKGIV
jgi:preprotein translocase subunit SecA